MDEKLNSGKLNILRQSLLKEDSPIERLKDSTGIGKEYISDIDSGEERDMKTHLEEVSNEEEGSELGDGKERIIEGWKLVENDLEMDRGARNLTKWIYDKRLTPSEVCMKDPYSFISRGDMEMDCSRFVFPISWDSVTDADRKRRFSSSELEEEEIADISAEDNSHDSEVSSSLSNSDSEQETLSDKSSEDSNQDRDSGDTASVDSQGI